MSCLDAIHGPCRRLVQRAFVDRSMAARVTSTRPALATVLGLLTVASAGALSAQGIDVDVPLAEERAEVDKIIFDELVEGKFTDRARARYVEVIAGLRARGCDGVALVCTEIPLLITPDVSPLPTLDSTRLLANAAFEVSVGERPLPQWRGGPVARAAGPAST